MLIKSAFRHRCKLRLDKKPPKIPSFRILEDEDVEEAEDEDHVREDKKLKMLHGPHFLMMWLFEDELYRAKSFLEIAS